MTINIIKRVEFIIPEDQSGVFYYRNSKRLDIIYANKKLEKLEEINRIKSSRRNSKRLGLICAYNNLDNRKEIL